MAEKVGSVIQSFNKFKENRKLRREERKRKKEEKKALEEKAKQKSATDETKPAGN